MNRPTWQLWGLAATFWAIMVGVWIAEADGWRRRLLLYALVPAVAVSALLVAAILLAPTPTPVFTLNPTAAADAVKRLIDP